MGFCRKYENRNCPIFKVIRICANVKICLKSGGGGSYNRVNYIMGRDYQLLAALERK